MARKKPKWIQQAVTNVTKKGALHRQLGYPQTDTLPLGLLKEIRDARPGNHVRGHTVTPLLKKRVNFALNIRRPRR